MIRQPCTLTPVSHSALIGTCVLVALASRHSPAIDPRPYLFISMDPGGGLAEIRSGQWWRLVTPVFIHFGWLHLILNMAWLWALGGIVERLWGVSALVALVLVIGVVSNLSQYLVSGPGFGGMSGVLYGLLGYLWMHGRFNPRSGADPGRPVVVMMLVWLVLCWIGALEAVAGIRIANTAHTTGLVAGLAPGYLIARISAARTAGPHASCDNNDAQNDDSIFPLRYRRRAARGAAPAGRRLRLRHRALRRRIRRRAQRR